MVHITESAIEEAKRLIDLHSTVVDNKELSITSALITTNELLEMYKRNGYTIGKYPEYPSYWEQVIHVLKTNPKL